MINILIVENAKYINGIDGSIDHIDATVNGVECSIPLDPSNRHYKEILRQVEEGTLTIADAEPVGEE